MMDYTVVLKAVGEKGTSIMTIEECPDVTAACVMAVGDMEEKFIGSEWAVAAVFPGTMEPVEGIPTNLKA